MKVVAAPQAFKGSLRVGVLCDAIAAGVRDIEPAAQVLSAPIADGGDGTIDALLAAIGGSRRMVAVAGPLGVPVEAEWALLADGETAVVELAAASGLALVDEAVRDPLAATTYGTGELLRGALDAGARRIILGLGGSATSDGATGLLAALGVRWLDAEGRELPPGGGRLTRLERVEAGGLDPRLAGVDLQVAVDVTNPLLGVSGAAAVYGPQKGARPEQVRQLEAGLSRLADVLERQLGVDVRTLPRGGAAGGAAAGIRAVLGAPLLSGVDLILELTQFNRLLEGADLMITGEGRLDNQTRYQKAPGQAVERARKLGVPAAFIAGTVEPGTDVEAYGLAGLCVAGEPGRLADSGDVHRCAARLVRSVVMRDASLPPHPGPGRDG